MGVGMGKWRGGLAAWALAGLMALSAAGAAAQEGVTVRDIEVVGAQRVDDETVRSYLRVKPGETLGPRSISDALKSLFDTGYFADASIDMRGDVMVVTVVENPIVNRIAFEGNRRIDDEAIGAEVQLKPRQTLTRSAVEDDVRRILEIYRRSGRFAVRVEPKLIQLPQNRVDVAFEIDEGEQTLIENIVFIGNAAFDEDVLLDEITSREAAWYRFLSSDDVYDPDRVAFDREQLRTFYLSQGYADFRVASAVAELTPDRDGFVLTFTLEEGVRYRFGALALDNRLVDIPDFRLSPLLKPVSGELYNNDLVEETIDSLTDEVGTFGFTFVDVRAERTRRGEDRVIDVVFEVDEGPRVYVERLDIEGNERTLDRVIRREFDLVEGDAFNTAKLRQANRRIRNLGYFQKVDITNERGSSADRTRVKVEVSETSTGELSLGAGYSTEDGALATVSLSERNFLGKGQELELATEVSARQNEIDLSFTEPYFQGRPISVGGDVFRVARDNEDESSFDLESTGMRVRVGYKLAEDWIQRWRYTLNRQEVAVNTSASQYIADERGTATSSIVGHELIYDTRNNRFFPSTGHIVSLSNDLSGLGGDVRYLRTDVEAAKYFPVSDRPNIVLSVSGTAGAVVGFGGDDVRVTDRYLLGGRTLRGFDFAGVGPRDQQTGDALGGNYRATGAVEAVFPLGLPQELGFRGRLFSEFGTLTGVDLKGDDILDESSIRAALGFGLSWTSPLGPLRLDFAWPVAKEDYDKDNTILFSFGTRL